ncbi:MAG: ATP-grasp domain-containing protein [Myxococcaceae bacterium]|nr:ATP-grasp domain-containing protein [Myxococcaceae bacterium]
MPIATSNPSAGPTPVLAAMSARITPARVNVGCNEVLAVLANVPEARLWALGSLPLGRLGHRLVAARYFIANGETWLKHFAWEGPLSRAAPMGPLKILELNAQVHAARQAEHGEQQWRDWLDAVALNALAAELAGVDDPAAIEWLAALHQHPAVAARLRARLQHEARRLTREDPRAADVLYLASYDLRCLPATTVGEGRLDYVLVADKGEMGVRAVREAAAFGATPVALFSETDDANALQVRLARELGGFAIGLAGNFKETYANPRQIAARVHEAFRARFGAQAEEHLARAALYPGYGPLAENAAAIQHFRHEGIVFIGPMQDVVERAGDKRRFRQLAESIDPGAVTPGIVLDVETDADAVVAAIEAGHAQGRFGFPARIKAANGGGGRGQVVCTDLSGVRAAVTRVLSEIQSNGWDPGVMFEQNIPETIHLEVQVLRDRFGNTRHFGMRDCSEQRASQKIQEEAPPALLRDQPELVERICGIAVRIADECGYVGACTVELMFKDGHFYLLEMNTRIQVEHPVTEEAHRVRTEAGLEPLDLVALQLLVASGRPIPFAQEQVVQTHVAREFRLNAESWRGDLKDPRDGKRGFFLPNAGRFEVLEVPAADTVKSALAAAGVTGIGSLTVRCDLGFAPGDTLVNKDPTFGKLIVAVQPEPGFEAQRYELLRLASLEVLRRVRIEGQQVLPTGVAIPGSTFITNLEAHVRILETPMLVAHGRGEATLRHVGWVVAMLRGQAVPNRDR